MARRTPVQKRLNARIKELEQQLQEAEETLRAIHEGQVDALVVSGAEGEQVYTLKGADHTFRVALETMNEGAVNLSAQGMILYCNRRFAEMVALPPERIQGTSIQQFIPHAERPLWEALLAQGLGESAKSETRLAAADGRQIPVFVSLAGLLLEDLRCLTMVVADLTEQKRAEEIMAAEKLARSILEQAAEAIVVCDPQGRIIQASQAATELCGRNPLRQRFDVVFSLDLKPNGQEKQARAPHLPLLARTLGGETLRNLQARLVRPDSQRLDLVVSAAPLRDSQGQIIGCTVTLNDITPLKRAERELIEASRTAENNRLILETVIQQMPAGIIVTDATGGQAKNNAEMDRLWRREMLPSENIHQHEYVALHPDGREYNPEEWPLTRALVSGQVTIGEEMTILRGDGTRGMVLVSASPIRDARGEIIAGVVVDMDITELREATEALRESQVRLRQLADASFEGLVVHKDGLLLDANARVTDILGYDPADLIGKPILDYIDPKYHDLVVESVRQGQSDPYEVELIHLNGRRVPIEVMGRPIVWNGQEARVAALRDMTARKRAEEELRTSEQKASDLVRYAPTAIYEIDFRNPRFKSVNDAMCQMSGYTREELLALNPFDLLDAPSQALFRDRIREVLAGRPVDESVEYRVKTRYDQDRYATLNTSLVYEDGKPVGAFVIAHDVTERKQAEAALHRLTQTLAHRVTELQTIMEVAPVGICIGEDPASRRITANQTLSEWLAAPQAANISLSAPEEERQVNYQVFSQGQLVPPEELPVQYATLKGRSMRNQELQIVRADGSCIDLLANAEPLRDEENHVRGAVATFMDITERKNAEEALRQSEVRYRMLHETQRDPFVQVSMDGKIIECNELFCQMLGYSSNEIRALTYQELTPERWYATEEKIVRQQILLRGYSDIYEKEYRRKDGTVFPVELRTILSRDPAGLPNAMWAIVRDITERKRAEAEREELLRREQAAHAAANMAVQMRDRFISVATHELRTPLTGIKGYAELLVQRGRQAGLDPEFQRMADTIYHQGERLEKLISAMLDISRAERGQLRLESEPVDLRALVASTIREVEPTLKRHHIEFLSNAEQVMVEGDPTRLQQVLENLIGNAVKYSPVGGPVTIHLRQESTRACIAVTDQGIGIPRSAQANLFTQFYRAANAEASHIGGLGVGLYVSREIMRLHQGDIQVESEEGAGSTFTVWLPLPPDPGSVDSGSI